jgi:serine/threonine protein kinase
MRDSANPNSVSISSCRATEAVCPQCSSRVALPRREAQQFPFCGSCLRYLGHVQFSGHAIWFDFTVPLYYSHVVAQPYAPSSLELTLSRLASCPLVPQEAVRDALRGSEASEDGTRFLRRLVSLGYLTRYQAYNLSHGRCSFDLGHYRVLDSVGRGASCNVFLAKHRTLERPAALKVARGEPAESRLVAEGNLFANIDHPQIETILCVERGGGVTFLARDFVLGSPLERRRGFISIVPWEAALAMVLQAVDICEHLSSSDIYLDGPYWLEQLLLASDGTLRLLSSSSSRHSSQKGCKRTLRDLQHAPLKRSAQPIGHEP